MAAPEAPAGAVVEAGTLASACSLLAGVPARVIPDAARKVATSANPLADS